jgi:hypothetical protein
MERVVSNAFSGSLFIAGAGLLAMTEGISPASRLLYLAPKGIDKFDRGYGSSALIRGVGTHEEDECGKDDDNVDHGVWWGALRAEPGGTCRDRQWHMR